MNLSPRVALRLLLVGALVGAAAACGKKGPPLPPLRPAPDKPTAVSVIRRSGDVTIRFTTPVRNMDGSEPFVFDRIDIYAMTVLPGKMSPTLRQLVDDKNKVGEAAREFARPRKPTTVKPVTSGQPADDADDDEPKPVPLEYSEKVAIVPLPPPPPKPVVPVTPVPPGAAPIVPVASPLVTEATRYYMLVPYANRTRMGAVSDFLPVALGPVPERPKGLTLKHDETTLTFTWTAVPGMTYQIYEATPPVKADARGLSPTLLTAAEFKRPVVFGARTCLTVRAVRTAGPVQFESDAPEAVCAEPVDTYPPAAPTGLVAFASEGSIDLTWDPVVAADLAGYLVLRGEGASETLQPLTPTPLTATAFKDTTARAGVRYIYAVVAVDTAKPANRSKESNRVEETGRTQR